MIIFIDFSSLQISSMPGAATGRNQHDAEMNNMKSTRHISNLTVFLYSAEMKRSSDTHWGRSEVTNSQISRTGVILNAQSK